jgi:selenocysteine lyase/cysteine desulfurase
LTRNKYVSFLIVGNLKIGVRWGMFYANRLCERTLGLGEEGVIRISFVHCSSPKRDRLTVDNTLEEVDRIIDHLKTLI